MTRDLVDGSERDPLDRLTQPFGRGVLARCTGIGHRGRFERAAAEREVRDHHGRDEPEGDQVRHEASHSGRLRTNSSGTMAHNVNAAARKNGPENALVTARSSWS